MQVLPPRGVFDVVIAGSPPAGGPPSGSPRQGCAWQNPTLTVMALAVRATDYLKKRLRQGAA